MLENNEKLYNKVRYSLKNLEKNTEILKHEELFKLYDSVINNKSIKRSLNYNINGSLTQSNSNKKNLIDNFIKDEIDYARMNLFNRNSQPKFYRSIKSEENITKKPDKNKDYERKAFITCPSAKITRDPKKLNSYILKENDKNNKDSFGKSLNDVLIQNINDEMVNKGILVQRPFSSKKSHRSELIQRNNNNFNNYDMHMKIFDQKMIKEFRNYKYGYELSQKKKLRNFSSKIADQKDKIIRNIPIYIKGYKKDTIDIFHSRNIFDLEYQKIYKKSIINVDEILHNQNRTGEYNFKKRKTPFYYLYRTVNNPTYKKLAKKKNKNDIINIVFNG